MHGDGSQCEPSPDTRLSGHFDRQGQAANAVAYGEPDPQNARPGRRSYLELWCCLLVFIEENRENNKLLIFIELFSDRTQLVSARETQLVSACVWTWDTASPMMGQKCPIKKTRRDKYDRSLRTSNKTKTERNTGNRQEGL